MLWLAEGITGSFAKYVTFVGRELTFFKGLYFKRSLWRSDKLNTINGSFYSTIKKPDCSKSVIGNCYPELHLDLVNEN